MKHAAGRDANRRPGPSSFCAARYLDQRSPGVNFSPVNTEVVAPVGPAIDSKVRAPVSRTKSSPR